jgi:hypothetical protein
MPSETTEAAGFGSDTSPRTESGDNNELSRGTMCHALIAEHMLTPNLDTYTGDDAIIDTFTQ